MIEKDYDSERLISSSQAAQLLGISQSTFYRYEKNGFIKPQENTGYKKLYLLSDLQKLAQKLIQEESNKQKEIAKKRTEGSYLYEIHKEQHKSIKHKELKLAALSKAKSAFQILKKNRRKALPFALGITLILIPVIYLSLKNTSKVNAATAVSFSNNASDITVDVPNRYRAVLYKGDNANDEYIEIWDRGQNDSSPVQSHTVIGPYAVEGATAFLLADDDNRETKVLEVTSNRVRIQVKGKLNQVGGSSYLDDDSGVKDIYVENTITFTPEGIYIESMVDFGRIGLGLDIDSSHNGYSAIGLIADATAAAFDETANIYYGNGSVETTTNTDNAEWATTNSYVMLPGQGSSTYSDAMLVVLKDGFFDANPGGSGVNEWHWDIDAQADLDSISVEAQNYTVYNQHYTSYFVGLFPESELDTEAERESVANNIRNPSDITINKGEVWNNGGTTGGIYFDGTDDYVTMGNASEFNFVDGDDFTVEAWINVDKDFTSNATILSKKCCGSAAGYDLRMNLDDDQYGARVELFTEDGTDGFSIYSKSRIQTPGWYHVAATFDDDSPNNSRVYINGIDDKDEILSSKSSSAVGSLSNTESFALGIEQPAGGNYQDFQGSIDEVRVWNHVRSAQQIKSLMNKEIDPTASGLLGYWKLNEHEGTNIKDETSNGNDGTIGGNAYWIKGNVRNSSYDAAEGSYIGHFNNKGEIKLEVDAGNNVATLINNGAGVNAGATSITVDSTTGFNTTGVAYINGDKIFYTGTTATTFTGIPTTGELAINYDHYDNDLVSLANIHDPSFKLSKYRSLTEPNTLSFDGTTLTNGTDYNASIKPLTNSIFLQNVTWYSSMENENAIENPNIGTGDSSGFNAVNGSGYSTMESCKYGNCPSMDGTDYVYLPVSSNIDLSGDSAGVISFWAQPNWDSTTTTNSYEFSGYYDSGSGDGFGLLFCGSDVACASSGLGTAGDLMFFSLDNNAIQSKVYISNADFNWGAEDWVNFVLIWDDTAGTNDLRIYINGGEPTNSHTNEGALDISALTVGTNWYLGATSSSSSSKLDGKIDEYYILSAQDSFNLISVGGETANVYEYLGNNAADFTMDLNAKDANSRGEYMYFGSDTKFSGLNIDLETTGVGGTSPNTIWEYWTGIEWQVLEIQQSEIGVKDFTKSGYVFFEEPENWQPYGIFASSNQYMVRTSLVSGTYTTDPVENLIKTDILLLQHFADLTSLDHKYEIPGVSASANNDKGSDPIAVWGMNESAGTTLGDATTNANNLTISGATWQTSGTSGGSIGETNLRFDGSNDYASISNDSDFNFGSGSFTISGWFKHSTTAPSSGSDVLVSHYGLAGYKVYMNTSGRICFGIDGDSTWSPADEACSLNSLGSFADNKWHRFSAVKNGTSSITLYIDGIRAAADSSLSASGSLNTPHTFYLGIDSDGTSNPWEGDLDQFVVYNYERSVDQIKADLQTQQTTIQFGNANVETLSQGLVAYWPLDDNVSGDAQTLSDASGNNYHLTTDYGGNTTGMDCTVVGKFGRGCDFDGTDDFADVSLDENIMRQGDEDQQFTLSLWAQADSNTGFTSLLGRLGFDGGITQSNNGGLNLYGFEISDNVGPDTYSIYTNDLSTDFNDWHHLVAVYDNHSMNFYLDGVLIGIDTISTSFYAYSSTFYLGGGVGNFDGVLDEARVYNRALNPNEVATLYNWAPGPVGYWDFNENTGQTIYDKSGNGNSATLGSGGTIDSGDPSWTTGRFGSALEFDGSTDFVYRSGGTNNLDVGKDLTISTWVFIDSIAADQGIIEHGDAGAAEVDNEHYKLYVNDTDGIVRFEWEYGVSLNESISSTVAPSNLIGNWVHLTVTRNTATKEVTFYQNGTQLGNKVTYTNDHTGGTDPADLDIGSNGDTPVDPLDGKLDELKVYDYVRTQSQIIEDMNGGHLIGGSPISSQLSYWEFDEGYGQVANDSGYLGATGGLGFTPNADAFDPKWQSSENCKINTCLDFDGTGDYVAVQDNSAHDFDDTEDFTITGWFSRGSYTTDDTIIAKKNDQTSSTAGFIIWLDDSTDNLNIEISDGGGGADHYQFSSNGTFTDATWHHFAVIVDESSEANTTLYIDGKKDRSATTAGTLSGVGSLANTLELRIGAESDAGEPFDGMIDEIKIYNSALTEDQVALDYNAGSGLNIGTGYREIDTIEGGSGTDPIGWWPIQENTGQFVGDLSSNNNYLTLGSTSSIESEDAEWKRVIDKPENSPGLVSPALHFYEANDVAQVSDPSNGSLDFADSVDFTIAAWIYRANATNDHAIVAKGINEGGTTAAGYLFWIDNTTDDLRLRVHDATDGFVVDSASTITTPGWHHVVAIYKDNDAALTTLYIDGKEDKGGTSGTISLVNSLENTREFRVGVDQTSTADFEGYIDDVKVWDRALNSQEVSYEYNRSKPAGIWAFDECTGATAYDSSGNGNNGTITPGDSSGSNDYVGECSSSNTDEMWNNGTTGVYNSSLDFDGTNDYVTVGNLDLFDYEDKESFTITAWVKRNSYNTFDVIAGRGNDITTGARFHLYMHTSDTVNFSLNDGSNGLSAVSTATITDAQWYHIAATLQGNGNNAKIYINGILDGESLGGNNSGMDLSSALTIGAESDGGNPFDGQLDDVRIYNSVLSAEQIKGVMNQGGSVRFGP